MMGKPGIPAPVAGELVVFLVQRIPDTGPVKERGPDKIVIAPYTIVDDTPLPPGQQLALDTLRLYRASLNPAEYRSLLDRNGFDVVSHVVEDLDCGGHTIWLAQLIWDTGSNAERWSPTAFCDYDPVKKKADIGSNFLERECVRPFAPALGGRLR
ncbi:hypothetical protein [Bradyrhizobium sp. URHC0002]